MSITTCAFVVYCHYVQFPPFVAMKMRKMCNLGNKKTPQGGEFWFCNFAKMLYTIDVLG